jgi:hypothetical protein
MKHFLNARFLSLLGIMGGAALIRILPHPWNMTPIAAMALFAGAHFESKWAAFLVPLGALFIGDLALGFYGSMGFIYACFALVVCIGMALKGTRSLAAIAAGTLAASLSFFALSYLGVWVSSGMYPHTGAGLLACYAAALPFFQHTLLGDFAYTFLLFGAFRLAEREFPILRPAALNA